MSKPKPLTISMTLSRPLPDDSPIKEGQEVEIRHGMIAAKFKVASVSPGRTQVELRGK